MKLATCLLALSLSINCFSQDIGETIAHIKQKGVTLLDSDVPPALTENGTDFFTFTDLSMVDSETPFKNNYILVPGTFSINNFYIKVWFFGNVNDMVNKKGELTSANRKFMMCIPNNRDKLVTLSFINQIFYSLEKNPGTSKKNTFLKQMRNCYDISSLDEYHINFLDQNLHKTVDSKTKMEKFFPFKFSILNTKEFETKLSTPEKNEAFAYWFPPHLSGIMAIFCPYDHKLLYYNYDVDSSPNLIDDFVKKATKEYSKSTKK